MKQRYPKVAGYTLVQQVGGGGFSTVYRAVNFDSHEVAAVKLVRLTSETTEKERKTLDKEMRIHAALKHENILEFKTAIIVEPNQPKSIYPAGIYMLLELAAGGDLFDKILPDVGLKEDISHVYFSQLIAGLRYIHMEGICHRDLKPENLLLDAGGTLKISDFGLCAVYKIKETGRTRMLSERCGSLPYLAPELCKEAPYEAEPVDVWGSGVILYTMLAGNTPWDEPTRRSYEYAHYLTGECFDREPWCRFSRDLLSLLTGMLAIDPSQRVSLAEVSQQPWVMRPSQIARRGAAALADHLTESLRQTGDLQIATPDVVRNVDADGDQIMGNASYISQFTQSLMFFSQTQSGTRYTPHLTRFYARLQPHLMLPLIEEALTAQGVKWKPAQEVVFEEPGGGEVQALRMRIGGHDRRRLMFKGWVELEPFEVRGRSGTYCIMARDQGNPISWRMLWKNVIEYPAVEPQVYRNKD
ncbi:CAMK/CAMKL/CHK1 protein kinase [Daedalea quercina L-15889]|uniref:non-specific serine/threonine protein kinase n=1 Tax=Daedalea quercina L-15889 TaxID=1314783 RepID=A0A165RRY2_9APHY|nr:CAMK/CAMKL/CHK1 protein kinase [Daedalea quercina L-15889]